MQVRRLPGRVRGFTLLELLIVVCIIAVLITLVVSSLASARKKAQIAVAKSNIQALKAALSMYEADTGRYPKRRITMPTGPTADLFKNDVAYLWAALRNRPILGPTVPLEGGPNSPYLEWKPEQIGYGSTTAISGSWDDSITCGTNPGSNQADPVPPCMWVQTIAPGDQSYMSPQGQSGGDGGQNAHGPETQSPYVFLDPWGNPYYYIEWASVPTNIKDQMTSWQGASISSYAHGGGSTGSGTSETHYLNVHDASKFDIWSFGPNGVNEGGDGDDVCSWTDVKAK